MQKAIKWLDAHKMKYTFHNYKEEGIDKATIESWLKSQPLSVIVNSKSTTFRALSEDDKSKTVKKAAAIKLMQANPSLIKRPVLDIGGKILVGFNEEEWTETFKATKSKSTR